MGLNLRIEVRDSEFLARLNDAKTIIIPRELENATEQIIRDSINSARDYPPETEANQPPPPYYQRGVGMIGRSGLIPGKESENLKGQWDYEISHTQYGVEGRITNIASYAGLVHDEDIQVPWHASRGWPTIQDLIRASIGDAQRNPVAKIAVAAKDYVEEAAQKIVDFFNK